MAQDLFKAIVLGLVEGITEFLPVSSTGHLIIVGRWLGIEGDRAAAFEIFIQLGAVLAVVWDFRRPLVSLVRRAPYERSAGRLLAGVFVAFLPAAVVGLLLHRTIKDHLFFDGPVAGAMIFGGLLILLVENQRPSPRTESLESITWGQALAVGCAQIVALFPGFSRSAATILGGLLVGLNRSVATEFSFYLAIPTLGAASVFALVKELPHLSLSDIPFFGTGFVVSFLAAAVVIRSFLAFVRTRTFRPFAWYRIAVGILIVAWIVRG